MVDVIDLILPPCYMLIMSVLKIVTYPARALKEVAEAVSEVTEEIAHLLDEMADIMYAAHGVGLAGPQIGKGLRLIVVDCGTEQPDKTIEPNLIQLVNPEIISEEGEAEVEEGCLSCPDFVLEVKRAAKVRIKALDKNGKTIEFDAEGLLAIALQHEVDHLNGITILDRVSRLKREIWMKEQKKNKENKEKEIAFL